MFQNIADAEISAGDAALFINSQLKGFSSQFDQFNSKGEASMHIIDSVNEVANNFAVGTNDLQLALSKTSSAMGGFGNSFEQTIGIITAGTEIMVGQPSKVARGWRTIGANITKLAKETDVYRDASGKVEIQMRKSDGTMKNTYEFLTDLHKSWGDLNKEQQTAIALQMGGKNQMEVFMATMNNFDTAIEATNTAMGAQGSAAKENSKYLESMAGHLANLKSAWEEFSYKMINSDLLKKGMDVLADTLHFLASDTGQAIIKLSLLATGLNLVAKAALGLKGLSLVKLFGSFTGIGKGAKGATDALKVMQGAQVGAAGSVGKLAGVFGKLTGSLLGTGGLVAGIGLLSVALAEYVPIGERAADIKLGKELKAAQDDLDKTEKKYKSLSDELEKLREKEKEGTLTDSESNRLAILENQTKQLERQLELKKQIAGNKADEYYHTVDPSKLQGKAKEKYTLAKSAGKSDKEALAAAGIHDKIALALNNEQVQAEKTAQAQQKVTEAYEHYGTESSQYKKAIDELGKAQDEQGDSLAQLEKKRKKAIKDYGSEEAASKKLGKSWKNLNKEIKALKSLKELNFKEPAKNMESLKNNANALGIAFSKSGKSIRSIDLTTFNRQMVEAGYNTEDTWNYLQALGKENPKMKVDVDGTKVALEDLEFVDGQIRKIDNSEAEVDIEAQDNASAKMDKIKKDKNLGKAQKKLEESGGNKVKTTMGKLTNTKSLGKANKNITQTGGDSVLSKLNTIKDKKSLGTATKYISIVANVGMDIVRKALNLKKGIRHFAAGGASDLFGNAEVNEQGFEIIQDARTGMMRVANGGKRGVTTLGKGDTVYTHGQSIRMLHKAGVSEGSIVYGHQNEDFGLFGVRKLNGFAKGKTSPLTQKQYNTKFNAITAAYDKALESLEYKKDKEHWLDTTYAKYYKQLYNKYTKKITALNKKKRKKGVKTRKTLGTDRVRAYGLAMSQISNEASKEKISSYIEGHQMTGSQLTSVLKTITADRKNKKLSADEAAQYRKEAYKKNLEYNLKQYQNDKKTYKDTLSLLKKYYKDGRLTAQEYYDYLDDLASQQLEKEKTRLQEQQELNENTYSLAKAYVQRQIDLLETENEEQEKQNDLVELQNNLAKARNQRIRVYKEGEGFVYEKDTEAIREATQALQEYQSSASNSKEALNPVLVQWQEVLKLFDELEADYELKALENKVGATVGELFGSFGTNTGAWSDWIKQNLSTTQGIGDVLTNLDKLVDTNDIINYLNSNGQVSQAIIDAAIGNNVLPATYAAAITQMAQGMSAGVNTATSLATQSSITAATRSAVVMGNATQYGDIYNFDNLVLPNVTNANEFINDLNNLSTTALQTSAQRG